MNVSRCRWQGVIKSLRSYWKWNAGAALSATNSQNSTSPYETWGSGISRFFTFLRSSIAATAQEVPREPDRIPPTYYSKASRKSLDAFIRVVERRHSSKRFDSSRPVDHTLIARLLEATTRAPTAFNLQPWVAIVVHETSQRGALSHAALDQPQPREAPVTVVFAGDMEPEWRAPAALELGLNSGYYHPLYGAAYLRLVYYHLHGGPFGSMAKAKSCISSWYSNATGTPLLSVPTTMQGYAWKQAMIPATTFIYAATAAGLDTAILEGFDEAKVREVVGLPERYTVPVIISVGYKKADEQGKPPVRSPRFSTGSLVRWNRF
ncbi:nitroreductase, putative [Trypanosoma brucei brucei TREU927]|uniref:Nitroreductase, putative n=2 Tax=Trypanosoma brucei TaxID=5691 RepID=Q57XU3_TRYB2|nr:nitroreductase, putative [Trypanosoma brucei brucei TREU927]AAX69576.1 nitroreductase, putative [Trypanosoma brucei]AAZ12784.1 nitroreductase, putative [Trypanosoma brucei brucei TREU927]RHW71408.1 nitroreductase [Trypanosoma brucei equiperdum]